MSAVKVSSNVPQPSVLPLRRSFLRGRPRVGAPALRPPWARDEAAFIAACTRCDACIEVCPATILVRADGGFPSVDFSRGECTFCAQCVARCEPHALAREAELAPPWALRASIGEACLAEAGVECRICGENCPAGAIRFRPRLGKVAQPLRVAITGTQVSPDISQTVYLAGREQALKRIDAALIKVATDA